MKMTAAMQARSDTVRGAPPRAREGGGGSSGWRRCHSASGRSVSGRVAMSAIITSHTSIGARCPMRLLGDWCGRSCWLDSLLPGVAEAGVAGLGHSRGAVGDLEFEQDGGDVVADGLLRQHQPPGDLVVAAAGSD
jgi:hypothetical protein